MDNILGNIVPLVHLDGNLNSSGDQQTVYRGYSAYQVALQQGFEGSKDEWLRALVGPQGETGVSISDVRLNDDFTLTVTLDDGTEFTTEPIKGDKGDKGDTGERGPQGQQGIQGPQGQKGQKGDPGEKGEKGQTGPQGETGPAFTYEDFTQAQLEGLRGPQGQTGPKGDKGQKGDTGQQGPQGPKGDKGDPGESGTNMEIHICSIIEYDSQTRVPTIVNANSSTFYLVPSQDGTSPDLFTEWVYVNNAWEMFGSASIDLSGYLTDVQINKTSIVENGVANVPIADINTLGTVQMTNSVYSGLRVVNGYIATAPKGETTIKEGQNTACPIVPQSQHYSAFYGLAKSAGDTTQSQSSNAVGNYTEDAKSAISEMLGGSVSVSGTTPTIVAKSGIRYVCGEVLSLDFTPSQTGICDVVFTSGATATVLTVPSTIKWANGFDPTVLEANTTYELNIMDGLGVACAWA